jgi:TetR/AcrR family transcriptional repressor of nem operon
MARPREFDREEALRAALKVFWSKGYDGSSFRDLETEMGLSRSSLVATFKDKQSLFEEALSLYVKEYSEPKYQILRDATSAKTGLRKFLGAIAESSISGKSPAGCFIVNSTVGVGGVDKKIGEFLESRLKLREKDILGLLTRAQETGELHKDLNIRSVSRVLQTLSLGIPTLARMGKSKAYFDEMIDEALRILS